jgi:hypothetical protein
VTIFGFAPGNLSAVMREMERHGKVEDYLVGGGNWAHLRYQTAGQAAQALSHNGNRVLGDVMVGVVPCTERGLRKLAGASAATHAGGEGRRGLGISGSPGTGMTPSRQRLDRSYNRPYTLAHLARKRLVGQSTAGEGEGSGPGGLNVGGTLRWDGRLRAPLMKRDSWCNRFMKWCFNV